MKVRLVCDVSEFTAAMRDAQRRIQEFNEDDS